MSTDESVAFKEKLQAAEEFVRKVISEDFGQRVSQKTIRSVALKVARTIPTGSGGRLSPASDSES